MGQKVPAGDGLALYPACAEKAMGGMEAREF